MRLAGAILLLNTIHGAAAPPSQPDVGPVVPRIEAQDQRFLARVARRAYELYLTEQTMYDARYTPPSLKTVACHVVVTLRHQRCRLGVGASGPGPVIPTTVQATAAAIQDAKEKATPPLPDSSEVLIEIEAIGDEQPVDSVDNWFQPGVPEQLLEPGVDGFTIRAGVRARRVCPSETVIKNQALSDAVKRVVEDMSNPVGSLRLYRFRTRHWYQATSGGNVVQLRRGLIPVTYDDLTRASISASVDRIGELLVYRQRPSGRFAYEYEPAVEDYTGRDEAVHQAGAAWALAVYASLKSSRSVSAAADAAIGAHIPGVKDLEGVGSASYVESEDGKNKLALTAQLALAIAAHRSPEPGADVLARLRAGMIWLQRPGGDFVTAFPPARRLPGHARHPALALLALLEQRQARAVPRTERVFDRALGYYQQAFHKRPTLESAAWLAQPFSQMAVACGRQEMARLAFEFGDWLIGRQLTPSNCRWPELHGGVVREPGMMPDISTAVALSGWLDCLSAARRFGEVERAKAYELAAQRAARFVLQLQMREPEAYFMRVAKDTVGGVRTSPADNRMPLENLQYALLALTKYQAVMFAGDS